MYVKRIRKIKNYKKRVVILKIVKDMDMSLFPPQQGTPLNVSTDHPRRLMRHPDRKRLSFSFLFFPFFFLQC